MHIVINHITLRNDVDWTKLQALVVEFHDQLIAQRSDFHGLSMVRMSDNKATLLVLFEDLEALNDISKNIAAPWFGEHIMPHLEGPVDRSVGEIVAGHLM